MNFLYYYIKILWSVESLDCSIAAVPVYIPTKSVPRVPFSPYLDFLTTAILTGVRMSHCGFDLHFPDRWS